MKVRDKTVPLTIEVGESESEYTSFERAFNKYFARDEYVVKKRLDHFIIFEYDDKEFECVMEVPKDCSKLPSNFVQVRFSPMVSPEKVK